MSKLAGFLLLACAFWITFPLCAYQESGPKAEKACLSAVTLAMILALLLFMLGCDAYHTPPKPLAAVGDPQCYFVYKAEFGNLALQCAKETL